MPEESLVDLAALVPPINLPSFKARELLQPGAIEEVWKCYPQYISISIRRKHQDVIHGLKMVQPDLLRIGFAAVCDYYTEPHEFFDKILSEYGETLAAALTSYYGAEDCAAREVVGGVFDQISGAFEAFFQDAIVNLWGLGVPSLDGTGCIYALELIDDKAVLFKLLSREDLKTRVSSC